MSELEIYLITTIRQMMDVLDNNLNVRQVLAALQLLAHQADIQYEAEERKRTDTKKLEGPGGLHHGDK